MVMSSSVSTAMTSMSCLMHTSGHMMVVFDEAVYLNNAMLIPLYLFVKVVCLNLGQNFYNGLLEFSPKHECLVIWGGESFFSDLDFSNRSHSVSNLVVQFAHKLSCSIATCCDSFLRTILENNNISFLFELNFIKDLDARMSRIKIIMEVPYVILGQSFQFSNFHNTSYKFLKGDLVTMIHFH